MSGFSFRSRMKKLEVAISARGPWQDACEESARQWAMLKLEQCYQHTNRERGFRALEKLSPLGQRMVEAYLSVPPTPGHPLLSDPCSVFPTDPGASGPMVMDPPRFEAAFAVWVEVLGIPDKPVTWTEVLCGETDYVRFTDEPVDGEHDPNKIGMAGPTRTTQSTPPEITGDEHASD